MRIKSLFLVVALVATASLYAFPTNATHQPNHNPSGGGNPPSVECASLVHSGHTWNGEYWKQQINNGGLGSIETNVSNGAVTPSLSNGTYSWLNAHTKAVYGWLEKNGNVADDFHQGFWENGEGDSDSTHGSLSHITICFTNSTPDPTPTPTITPTPTVTPTPTITPTPTVTPTPTDTQPTPTPTPTVTQTPTPTDSSTSSGGSSGGGGRRPTPTPTPTGQVLGDFVGLQYQEPPEQVLPASLPVTGLPIPVLIWVATLIGILFLKSNR